MSLGKKRALILNFSAFRCEFSLIHNVMTALFLSIQETLLAITVVTASLAGPAPSAT